MVETFDQVHLNFSPESLQLLNICLAFIMFGIALELKVDSFKALLQKPKPIIVGIISQLLLLPLLTFLLVNVLQPHPSFALGMMMVAACPGGNVSNFFSLLSKGNTELSVSLTAIGTLSAIVFTPLNFAFWGGLYPPTAALLSDISVNPIEIFKTVLLLLAIPLVLGMLAGHYFPKIVAKTGKPLRILSMLFLAAFIVVAFVKNFEFFLAYINNIIFLVLIHNAVALLLGFYFAKLNGLPLSDAKTLSIETGIQNSGLALVLIFNFFGGLGGMALIAALWGIWHIIAGMSLAWFFSKKAS